MMAQQTDFKLSVSQIVSGRGRRSVDSAKLVESRLKMLDAPTPDAI